MISPGQLGMIHVAKKQLNLADADYLDILKLFNRSSSADLTQSQAGAVIEILKARGFVPSYSKKKPTKIPGGVTQLPTPEQMELIDILKANIPWKYENGYDLWLQKRMKINKVSTKQQAVKVIEGLKGMLKIDHDIIKMRGLPFPLRFDEEFFFVETTGEILPFRWVYDTQTGKLLKVANEDYE